MKGLKICLWVWGILCLPAVISLFLPFSVFESIARYFNVEKLPDWPLFLYAIRTGAGAFVVFGVFSILLALNPLKYGCLVPFQGISLILIGIVCLLAGIESKMQTVIFLCDAFTCIILGALILFFYNKAKKPSTTTQ